MLTYVLVAFGDLVGWWLRGASWDACTRCGSAGCRCTVHRLGEPGAQATVAFRNGEPDLEAGLRFDAHCLSCAACSTKVAAYDCGGRDSERNAGCPEGRRALLEAVRAREAAQ